MNTIEAYENDIKLQLEFLKNFKKQKPLSANHQKNIIFTGSGDSLASAKLAEVFSNFRVKSMDPLDLLKNKSLAKNKTVYFVSISLISLNLLLCVLCALCGQFFLYYEEII